MTQPLPDPFQLWRDWLKDAERQWHSAFNESLATDQFSSGVGSMMDAFLHGQKTVSEGLGRYLASLNLPSRTDILDLGHRLTEIERRLDAIEGVLETRPASSNNGVTDAGARPPRTRRPA